MPFPGSVVANASGGNAVRRQHDAAKSPPPREKKERDECFSVVRRRVLEEVLVDDAVFIALDKWVVFSRVVVERKGRS